MHNHTTLNDYDPGLTRDTQRIKDGGASIDSRVIPMHSNVWAKDGKYRLQDLGSRAGLALPVLKQCLSRYWPVPKRIRMNRPPIITTKSSLTNPTPATSNAVFILLCGLWYSTSALSSNTGKAILTQFRYPITLTFVQFGFVALYCLLFMTPIIRLSRMRIPTKSIVKSTLPMGMFQVGGHMFSSMAISRIPVSTVHTIKALSPLFTVAAYALLFRVSYSAKTYISLIPLTIGVMLACSFDMSASNAVGLLCAFGSALVFVSSNIFFKKIMPSNIGGLSQPSLHKLDKLNLLLYSSSMAFLLMIPIWMYYDLPVFISAHSNPEHVAHPSHGHTTPHSVTYYFVMNGTVHFAQNIIAFVILSSTSPVTYSIASLIKRVAVICIAIAWFNQTVHPIQAFGITMTFVGLYMYDNAKADVERGENKMRRVEAARDMMLPTTKADMRVINGTESPPPELVSQEVVGEATSTGRGTALTYGRPRAASVAAASHSHYYHTQHLQLHPISPPNLSIKIVSPSRNVRPTSIKEAQPVSPTDSYPSPPPSLDSPPSNVVPLDHARLEQIRPTDIQERLGPALSPRTHIGTMS